ncbi:MAG: rod shape-determining protein MreC [Solirubrobacteraceae bacterium]|nr:rod shape-determining protein MreC [Solirubrobacteraceae bacterium]
MYDKTVRRRRAVLALLVASSLILLTAYFGESTSGGLHSVQRGVLQVVSPVQEGASRALKPFRDFFGWAGDTISAKGKVNSLTKERNQLYKDLVNERGATAENVRLQHLLDLDGSGLAAYKPITARVIGSSPTLWYATIVIDKGSSAGLRVDMPVIAADENSGALVGRVTNVTGDAAQVTLITDHTVAVPARVVADPHNNKPPRNTAQSPTGDVQTEVGQPNDLILQYTTRNDDIRPGDSIVSAGLCSSRVQGIYPPDLPIGKVTAVQDPGTDAQKVHVHPLVNMRRIQFVQVLSKRVNGNKPSTCLR